ncbi:MAG: hypothetical protein JWM11_7077 [Planctomycetaceae bacterium]|nr:hypothetical protein [Planctomycetaceae bacterium]
MIRFSALFLLIASLATAMLRAEDPAAETYSTEERSHWSLQPRSSPTIPKFNSPKDIEWVSNPIDALILTKLREQGLSPTVPADRRTLARRIYFDLIGLPPTPTEIESFVNDTAPDAYYRLIERLLASPQYGERWGQHWLDVVRFAETEGFEYDRHLPHAWRYRDYVVRSFQEDKPYDQFLREQLAGDELSPISDDARIAAGFLRFGPIRRNAGNPDVAFSRNEVLTEMTDTVGVAFLSMTVGCARCHDHKFDPIRQKDYYRLQAFFASAYEYEIPLSDPALHTTWKAETDKVNAEVKKLEGALDRAIGEARKPLQEQLKAAERRLPAPLPAISSVRNDDEKRTVIHVLKRGDDTKPGEQVGPRVPGVLLPDSSPQLLANVRNPKTQLAAWITDPQQNPLTPRVIVNRIWLQHFGAGLVRTPNDFGMNGELPSHPALVELLAHELVRSGWSIKALHRLILSSNTYQQASSSADQELGNKQDPVNRLLWKFPRRRLDSEQIRDAMLAVSGKLNFQAGGPSVIVPVDSEMVELLYKPSQWTVTEDISEHSRRSIYLIRKRNLRLPFMDVFDQPAPLASCPKRDASTHAPQALELLNGPLSNELAAAFALRLARQAGPNRTQQVQLAFELVAGREPTIAETELSLRFLESQSLAEFALAMFNLNEFLYVK